MSQPINPADLAANSPEDYEVMPTLQMYAELQRAFDFFNVELFEGKLPPCMITLQRQKKTQGYFSPGRFTNRKTGELVDEIAMNPSYFAVQSIIECMQTLVHEMSHAWQHHWGNPGRARYHNREWAEKLESIGLMPSNTGRPGGKKTGDTMGDYIIEDGPFAIACKKLLTKDFALSWLDRFPVSIEHLAHTLHQLPEEVKVELSDEELKNLSIEIVEEVPKKKTTFRYVCPICQLKVWGKPNLEVMCAKDKEVLQVTGEENA